MTEGPYKLPKGWRWVRLKEVARREVKTIKPSDMPDHVFNYLGMEHVAPNQWEEPKPKSRLGVEIRSSAIMFWPGLVLYGKLRPYLNKVVVPSTEGIASTEFVPIKPDEKLLLPSFLGAFLRSPSFVSYATSNTTGSRQPRIRMEALWNALIPLPPLPEQRRIVARIEELMERVREARRLREEAKKDADYLMQAALAEVFSRPGVPLPPGWRWVKLGEVCRTKMGGTPKTKVKEYWEPSEVIWVTPEDMAKDVLNRVRSSRRQISAIGLQRSSAKLLPVGTVLLTTTATIGKVGIAETALATNQQVTGIMCDSELDPYFLAYYLLYLGDKKFRELGGTATATHVNQTTLRGLIIPLPPLSEQRCIVAYLDQVQTKVTALKKTQESTDAELHRLEQAILDKAFRGELLS